MPQGLQFTNLNRYRRYPFADDADLSASTTPDGPKTFTIPDSFMRMFRMVVVHGGDLDVVSAALTRIKYRFSRSPAVLIRQLGFTLYDSEGFPVRLKYKDGSAGYEITLSFARGQGLEGFVSTFFNDFDFAHCISVGFDIRFSEIIPASSSINLNLYCDIKFAPDTLLTMRAPNVMSISDDSGNSIRDCELVKLEPGYNVKFDVMKGSNTILVSPLKGAGKGRPCDEAGLSVVFSSTNLHTVNGVCADPSGNLSLAGGGGLSISHVTGNILNVYSKTKTKQDMKCAAQ